MDNPFTAIIAKVDEVQRQLPMHIRRLLEGRSTEIMEMMYDQLESGKAASGADLRPYYTEDLRYFKSVESARRYADWKQDISPSSNRNPLAPNLYITGKFWAELGVRFGTDAFWFYGTTDYAKEIVDKYGTDQLDLTREHLDELGDEILPQLDIIVTNMLRG